MSIRSRIEFMKTVEKGTSVSYGRRYYTPSKTNIASVSIGYADGISRRLTNKANVLVNGKKYPVVGTICMDQLMINVGRTTGVQGRRPGDVDGTGRRPGNSLLGNFRDARHNSV